MNDTGFYFDGRFWQICINGHIVTLPVLLILLGIFWLCCKIMEVSK